MNDHDDNLAKLAAQSMDFRRALEAYLGKSGFTSMESFRYFEPFLIVENTMLKSVDVSALLKLGQCVFNAELKPVDGKPEYRVNIACPHDEGFWYPCNLQKGDVCKTCEQVMFRLGDKDSAVTNAFLKELKAVLAKAPDDPGLIMAFEKIAFLCYGISDARTISVNIPPEDK